MLKLSGIFKICVIPLFAFCCSCLCFGVNDGNPQKYTEDDLNRILVLTSKLQYKNLMNQTENIPEGTFLVFTGFDDLNRVECLFLSGPPRKIALPGKNLQKTKFFKGVPPYDVVIDALLHLCAPDVMQKGTTSRSLFVQDIELLKILGRKESLEPVQTAFRKINAIEGKIKRSMSTVRRLKREARAEAIRNRKSGGSLWDNSSMKMDKAEEIETNLVEKLRDETSSITELLNVPLKENDVLVAAVLYQVICTRYSKNIFPLFSGCSAQTGSSLAEIRNHLSVECWEPIQNEINARLSSQTYPDEFRKEFPEAIGTWSKSRPSSKQELFDLLKTALTDYQKSSMYSRSLDFEKWGNYTLSILMFTENTPEAEYIKNDFVQALKAYRQSKGTK